MSKKMFSLLLAACMLIGLLAGCGSNSNSSTTSGGATAAPVETTIPEAPADAADATAGTKDLVFVISSDNGDLSPFGGDSGGRHHTYRMIYDCLCASYGLGNTVNELQGQIAKSWTIVDGTTVDVEIYDYVKDSKGNPITAEDVVYSYEQAIASGTMEKLNGYLDKVVATGDYTLRITLTSASKGAMEWTLTTVPIISKAWFSAASDADKTSAPAVTGAYVIKEFSSGSHTTLERNPDYWQTDASLRSYYDSQYYNTITVNVLKESSMV